jgi:hypothetical protein
MDEWPHRRAHLLRRRDCGCRQKLQGGQIPISSLAFGVHSSTWVSLKLAINRSLGFSHEVFKTGSGQMPANAGQSGWIENDQIC